jgi:hypothetical protein
MLTAVVSGPVLAALVPIATIALVALSALVAHSIQALLRRRSEDDQEELNEMPIVPFVMPRTY